MARVPAPAAPLVAAYWGQPAPGAVRSAAWVSGAVALACVAMAAAVPPASALATFMAVVCIVLVAAAFAVGAARRREVVAVTPHASRRAWAHDIGVHAAAGLTLASVALAVGLLAVGVLLGLATAAGTMRARRRWAEGYTRVAPPAPQTSTGSLGIPGLAVTAAPRATRPARATAHSDTHRDARDPADTTEPASAPPPPRPPISEVLAELDALAGMERMKEQVRELVDLVEIQRRRTAASLAADPVAIRLRLEGPPGTGKTTVARIVARAGFALEVLDHPEPVEVDRADLVDAVIGGTAIKTRAVIDSAAGRMLFIDEAYSLAGSGAQDFGHEAIATLLKAIEDNRYGFAVALAGYPEDMERLMASNAGLRSRFTRVIAFDPYPPEQVAGICAEMLTTRQYTLVDAATPLLLWALKDLYTVRGAHWANAREARNLTDACVAAHARRVAATGAWDTEALTLITIADVSAARDALLASNGGSA